MLIQTDLRSTHVMAPVPQSETKGVLRVERRLVEDLQDYEPGWRVWGEKIDSLSPLWPYKHFRDLLLRGAKKYVFDLSCQGWRLLTNEGDLVVWGPCVARNWAQAGQKFGVVQGRTVGEEQFLSDVYDFLVDGQWLASTYLMETPTPQPQHRLSRSQRQAANKQLFPGRRMGS